VQFVDGRIARDTPNPHPLTAPPAGLLAPEAG
jgi:hypothetical protein